ncbi:hypothetical protein, partial [Streptomyces thermoalcalitolerans]
CGETDRGMETAGDGRRDRLAAHPAGEPTTAMGVVGVDAGRRGPADRPRSHMGVRWVTFDPIAGDFAARDRRQDGPSHLP